MDASKEVGLEIKAEESKYVVENAVLRRIFAPRRN
jgi:hypothetical protein